MLARLVHGRVARGARLSEDPTVARWGVALARSGHRLGWLPLAPVAVELETLPCAPRTSAGAGPPLLDSPWTGDLVDLTTDAFVARASRPFERWLAGSNGRVDCGQFRLDTTSDALTPGMVAASGLACVSDEIPTLHLVPCSAALAVLLSCSQGGAYSGTLGSAYGRHAAWQAIAALAGAPASAPFQRVVELAAACTWAAMDSGSDGFDDVAWDVALVCLRPARDAFAMLAATDTD